MRAEPSGRASLGPREARKPTGEWLRGQRAIEALAAVSPQKEIPDIDGDWELMHVATVARAGLGPSTLD